MSPPFPEKEKQLSSLQEFLKSYPGGKECLRALAVKLALEGYTYRSIAQIIGCSPAFISKWKNAFEFGGIEGLKSGYKGSSVYLNSREREKIIDWLIEKEAWDITELESHVLEVYDVVFKSRQSYYSLLKEARISWQKGEHINPRQDPEQIRAKNEEIAGILEEKREEIEGGKLKVYLIDECHLHWEDICGYLWNFIKNPLKIPLKNPRERQTYYGALDLMSGEFIMFRYPTGNGEDWRVTCVKFAPYAPQCNPVEAIWLQLKTLLRRAYRFGKTFKIVKRLFEMFVDFKLFNLPDLKRYDAFSQFV
ncbi:IS630 family transposase [Spirulina subsalsa FACHB-351]|uniref:IS630 family transposase n=1 Tax=Spirulina subsalsa FACHB-351 TaxID=234711 RepID=A0ABT3L354_9CYAN|nr:IS630 family transposase [Spirulina subsalsa]MCW6035910.1 IS630 family transposase [Spirulina subsalsa FACHB-351]